MTGSVFRVDIRSSGVDLLCFDYLKSVDSSIEGHYHSCDDLPKWVQERLATLMIMGATPPTTEVEGVGRRISETVFWIYEPKPEDDPYACGSCE